MKYSILLAYSILVIIPIQAQMVGIGTTSPTNMLSVVGTSDFSDSVGIGTSHPLKKLDVNGDALIHTLTLGQGGGNQVFNTAFGVNSLSSNSSGIQNTAIGYLSLAVSTSGGNNVGIGSYALNLNTTGSGNTGAGQNALQSNTTGSLLTAIGQNAGVGSNNLTNATAIGANALVSTSNSLILGNNVNVGIGTSSPTTKLEVAGAIKTTNLQMTTGASNGLIMQSDASGNGTWVNAATIESDPQVGALSTNKIPKWADPALVNGILFDNGTNIGLGTTSPGVKFDIRATNNGVRLWSGALASFTSLQLGRTSTDGTLGVAAGADNYAVGAMAGDIIMRTELSSQKLLLNTGIGNAALAIYNGNVGIGTYVPSNKLDVNGNMAIGSEYSGTSAAPVNGAIFEGNVGIGTNSPFSTFHIASVFPKTNTNTNHLSFFTTNEPIASNPFGLRISIMGAASLQNRAVLLQTTDVNLDDGGTISLQKDGGQVAIGTINPATTLDVDGGIRTKYGGSVVMNFDPNEGSHNLTISPALPADWTSFNTVVLLSIADGPPAQIKKVHLQDAVTISFTGGAGGGPTRYNFIIFRI